MISRLLLFAFLFSFSLVAVAQKQHVLTSPDGKIKVTVSLQDKLSYSVTHEQDQVLASSPISLQLANGEVLGNNPKLLSAKQNIVNQTIKTPVYKRAEIKDHYCELVLRFKGDYQVLFRAYNDGVAYRFATTRKKDFMVQSEEASFNFAADHTAVVPYVAKDENATFEDQFFNSFENRYTHAPLSKLNPKRLAFLPLAVEVTPQKKVVITEADLESYPGMYLNNPSGKTALTGVFPAYPKKIELGGYNQLQQLVKEREGYLAKVKGTRSFPWRVLVISSQDKELADSDMVYKLASPSRVADASWVKPGKVAWEWWNAKNLEGVDFKTGVNNDTYKYYIDFASKNKINYVILDEGWAVDGKADLMQIIPEINLPELIAYGKQRNVGLILWAGYYAFDRDMDNIARHYANMGIKGFKVDFIDRDDQQAVDFYYKAAQVGAKYKLLMDFHGAYKPTGLQRTYPNVINFEGVHGLEQMKWSGPESNQVTYDVTMPYLRMLAGPVDYTQGAMRNASKNNYRAIGGEPMSQGTRVRQLAMYVVFESPLNMLADSPTNYEKEEESTKFIASVPEVWDNTVALSGKLGEHLALARRKGNEWYIGALTNWDPREMELDLSFLGQGNYKIELFKDGRNADRKASDYKREVIDLPQNKKLKVSMAPGGGFAARIYKE